MTALVKVGDNYQTENTRLCAAHIDASRLDQVQLSDSGLSSSYLDYCNATNQPIHCVWVIQAPPSYRVWKLQ